MRAKKTAISTGAYVFKIVLIDSQPAIWRRVAVPASLSLPDFHRVIQSIMPWADAHPHSFHDKDGTAYANPAIGLEDSRDEAPVRLSDLFSKSRQKLVYQYDFNDCWDHAIELEKTVALESPLPRCLAGERAAPPDDCGGIWGYVDMLVAYKEPKHSAHAQMVEWAAGSFKPEVFDIEAANRGLKDFQMRGRSG